MNQNDLIKYFDAIASASSSNPISEASIGQWAQAKEARLLDFVAKASSIYSNAAGEDEGSVFALNRSATLNEDEDQYLEILYPINNDAATWVRVNVECLAQALDSETEDALVEIETVSGPVLVEAEELLSVINNKITALDSEAALSSYLATISSEDTFTMTEFMQYCESRGYNYAAYVQNGLIEQFEGHKPGAIFRTIGSGLNQLKETLGEWKGISLPIINIEGYMYSPGSSLVINTAIRIGTGIETVTTVGAFIAVVVGGILRICKWVGDKISGFFSKILDDTTSFINVNSLAEACGCDLPIMYVRIKNFSDMLSPEYISPESSMVYSYLRDIITDHETFNGQITPVIDASHGESMGFEPLYGATMAQLGRIGESFLSTPGYYTFPIDGNNVLIATDGVDVVFSVFATEYSVEQVNSTIGTFSMDDLYLSTVQRRDGLRNPSTNYQDMACLLNCYCEGHSGDYLTSSLHELYYDKPDIEGWESLNGRIFRLPPDLAVGQRKLHLLRDLHGIPGLDKFFTNYGEQCARDVNWKPWMDVDPNSDMGWINADIAEATGTRKIFGPKPTDFFYAREDIATAIDYERPRPWSRDVLRFLPCAPSLSATDLGDGVYDATSVITLPDLVHGPRAIANYFSPFYLDTEKDQFRGLNGRTQLLVRVVYAILALYAAYTSKGRAMFASNPGDGEASSAVGRFSSGTWYDSETWVVSYSELISTADSAALIYLPYTTSTSIPQYSYHVEDFNEYTTELAGLATAISVALGVALAVSAMVYFRMKLTPKMIDLDRQITRAKVNPDISNADYQKLVKRKRRLLQLFGWLLPASVTAGAVGGSLTGSLYDSLNSLIPSGGLTDSEKLAMIYKILCGKDFEDNQN